MAHENAGCGAVTHPFDRAHFHRAELRQRRDREVRRDLVLIGITAAASAAVAYALLLWVIL